MKISERRSVGRNAKISICIPHYNRMMHLIEALKSFAEQVYRDFEIIISDDNSTDDRLEYVLSFLNKTDLSYVYWRNATNNGYDRNIRCAIELSSAEFILLMGNDDRLSGPLVLSELAAAMERYPKAGAMITNYRELTSGQVFRRTGSTGSLGTGPLVAARNFRNYSFVSGIVLHGPSARSATTAAVDGSEMYQMYLGTKLVADGRDLIQIDAVCVEKDLSVNGEEVDSYRRKHGRDLQKARKLPMRHLLRVVWAGIQSSLEPAAGRELCGSAAKQLYSYTYPFWGIEYRRTKSWIFAANVVFGVRPSIVAASTPLSMGQRAALWLRYLVTCGGSLLVPIRAFDALHPRLYRMAKR